MSPAEQKAVWHAESAVLVLPQLAPASGLSRLALACSPRLGAAIEPFRAPRGCYRFTAGFDPRGLAPLAAQASQHHRLPRRLPRGRPALHRHGARIGWFARGRVGHGDGSAVLGPPGLWQPAACSLQPAAPRAHSAACNAVYPSLCRYVSARRARAACSSASSACSTY